MTPTVFFLLFFSFSGGSGGNHRSAYPMPSLAACQEILKSGEITAPQGAENEVLVVRQCVVAEATAETATVNGFPIQRAKQ